ncbi:MAG: hypothetical protein ABFS37_12035, partial [Acidobacteriota bacterium]
MLKKILVGIGVFLCAVVVHAEPPAKGDGSVWAGEHSMDVMPFSNEYRMMEKGAGVTVEDVGDPDSFGREKTYLGMVHAASVSLRDDCSTYPPEAGRCVELNPAPATTNVDEADLAVIELPKNATNSLLCFTFTPFSSWEWFNGTGSQQTARMFLRPAVRIESEVLDDPSLIDPGTGLPFNGVLVESTVS